MRTAVGVLQHNAERLEDVSDDTRLAAGLVELTRTHSNRRAGRTLPAWPPGYTHRPTQRAGHPSHRLGNLRTSDG